MKLYTGNGDKGTTALFGGECVRKDNPQVVCYGKIDALNAQLGLVNACSDISADMKKNVTHIQHRLFDLGSYVAMSKDANDASRDMLPTQVQSVDVKMLEQWIDVSESQLPALKSFILPGGSELAARLHLARVVAREVEGLFIALIEADLYAHELDGELVFLNRLSDLFFSWARLANQQQGVADVLWEKAR